jgi:hypothetical protein
VKPGYLSGITENSVAIFTRRGGGFVFGVGASPRPKFSAPSLCFRLIEPSSWQPLDHLLCVRPQCLYCVILANLSSRTGRQKSGEALQFSVLPPVASFLPTKEMFWYSRPAIDGTFHRFYYYPTPRDSVPVTVLRICDAHGAFVLRCQGFIAIQKTTPRPRFIPPLRLIASSS